MRFFFEKLTDDSPAIGRIICAATRSNVFHVETQTGDKRYFSAHFSEGVRFVDALENENDPAHWEVIESGLNWFPEMTAWCNGKCGEKYDVLGALNSALGIPICDASKDFCSHIAEELCAMSGMTGLCQLPSPARFRADLRKYLGILTDPAKVLVELGNEDFQYLHELLVNEVIDQDLSDKLIHAAKCGF